MQALRIGLDIDDVLIRTGEHTIELYNKAHGTTVGIDHWYRFDPPVWGVSDISEAVERVRTITKLDTFDDVAPVDGAKKVIERLLKAGHQIFAITGRPEDVRTQTLRILEKYYPGFFSSDTVFFTDHYGASTKKVTKTEIATSLGLDYFVDDQVFHVNDLNKAGFRTILFSDDYVWSQAGEDEGVVRVKNWEEIGAYLDDRTAK